MKTLKIAVIAILVLNGGWSLYQWMSPEPETTSIELPAAQGLDLKALTTLSKEIRGGQELERRLNEKDGINNLDLNGDNKVDYLNVKEFGDQKNKIGYAVITEPVKGEVQEVAEIMVEKNGDRAEIQVRGNEQIYGEQAIYNDSAPIEREKQAQASGGAGHYPSYFYPRPPWFSPFGFGYYPSFFSFYPVIGYPMYMGRMGGYSTTTVQRGVNSHQAQSNRQINNPQKGKTANKGITRSLKKPTGTQKKFQMENRRKSLKKGGFGQGSQRVQKSQGQRRLGQDSRRSLRQNRSSGFGRTGSFRSSSYGGRSFSFGGK